MKVALKLDWWSDEDLIYARQLAVGHLIGDAGVLAGDSLTGAVHRVRACGLVPEALETVVRLDSLAAEAGTDTGVSEVIAEAARVGIPRVIVGWHTGGDSAPREPVARGGGMATVLPHAGGSTTFSEGLFDDVIGRWLSNAEKHGVSLAVQPMPPGLDGPLADVGGLLRLLGRIRHPRLEIDLCLDHVRARGDESADAMSRLMASGRVAAVRVGCVVASGSDVRRHGEFIDLDPVLAVCVEALVAVGFDGTVRLGYTPAMDDDTDWGHTGHAYAIGYLKALIDKA